MTRIRHGEPFTTVDELRLAEPYVFVFFTPAKAERDLGFRARPYRQARQCDRLVPRRRILDSRRKR